MSQVFEGPKNLFSKIRGFIMAITTRCNFNCPHCNRQIYDRNKTLKQDLPLPLYKEILKKAKERNFVFVSFSGGEPILHPRFEIFISIASDLGYVYGIASNGFFYEKYWSILKKYGQGLTFLNFSVDGATAEIHDKVRNFPGSFKKAVEAVKFFKDKNIPVKVTTCFTKNNYLQAEEMSDLFYALRVDEWRCTAADLSLENGHWQINDEEKVALKKILEEIKRSHPLGRRIKILSGIQSACPDKDDFCGMLKGELLAIDPAGGMLFCCDIYEDCPERPFIQKDGFESAVAVTLASAGELKKRRGADLDAGLKFPGFDSCDYCNFHIKRILRNSTRRECG